MNKPKLLNSLNSKHICLLKADSNYTLLFTRRGKKVVSAYSLKVFEELLSNQSFVRVDRSNLVHISFIKHFDHSSNEASVTLLNSEKLRVPRRKLGVIVKQMSNLQNQTQES